MRICPKCGFHDSPSWKPYFWGLYWEYMDFADFKREYPSLLDQPFDIFHSHKFCEEGNFYYNFEDNHYYYKIAGKTRKVIRRFPKGFESMANRKLFEKTPSEKSALDLFQKKLLEVE